MATHVIELKKLTEVDLNLLVQWFKAPHVTAWWRAESFLDEEALKTKYRCALDVPHFYACIAYLENRPIGYIQFYSASKEHKNYWWQEPAGTYGIDLFIGELDCLGKGYGAQIIKQACAQLFAQPVVNRIIIDPDPKNMQAIRCYEKVGFKRVGLCETPEGTHLLMELLRSTWEEKNL